MKLNPKVALPNATIAVVHRSDGSGTTYNFATYLSKASDDWKTNVGESTALEWPVGLGSKGNEGVAVGVAQTRGSIGYVEYAYAVQNKMTYANMVNHDGRRWGQHQKRSRLLPPMPTGCMPPGFIKS